MYVCYKWERFLWDFLPGNLCSRGKCIFRSQKFSKWSTICAKILWIRLPRGDRRELAFDGAMLRTATRPFLPAFEYKSFRSWYWRPLSAIFCITWCFTGPSSVPGKYNLRLKVWTRSKRSSKNFMSSCAKRAGLGLLLFTMSSSVSFREEKKRIRRRAFTSSRASCASNCSLKSTVALKGHYKPQIFSSGLNLVQHQSCMWFPLLPLFWHWNVPLFDTDLPVFACSQWRISLLYPEEWEETFHSLLHCDQCSAGQAQC